MHDDTPPPPPPSIADALGAVLSLPSSWVGQALVWNWLGTNDAQSWRYAVTARAAKDAGDERRADYWLKRLNDHAIKERERFIRKQAPAIRRALADHLTTVGSD